MADESRAIWDPLWEYVLDDYERDAAKTSQRRRRAQQHDERSAFVRNGLCSTHAHSSGDDYESTWKLDDIRDDIEALTSPRTWDSAESSQKKSKRHPWRRNNSNSDEHADNRNEGSMWDLFVPSDSNEQNQDEKPRQRGILKNWKVSGRGNSAGNSKETSRATRTYDTEVVDQAYSRKGEKSKKGKRRSFFRRRSQKDQEDLDLTLFDKESVESLQDMEDFKEPETDLRRSQRSRSDLSRDQAPDEKRNGKFDPLSIFFEVAEKLDPWATDSDSNSETTEGSGKSFLSDERTHQSAEASSYTPQETVKLENNLTEIRLQYRPFFERAELKEFSSLNKDPSCSINDSGSVVPFTRSRGDLSKSNSASDTMQDDPMQVPSDGGGSSAAHERVVESTNSAQATDDQKRSGLRRFVCCSVREHSSEVDLNPLSPDDIKDLFPATRMISDGRSELSSVFGKKSDFQDGVMGIPSDRFLGTQGPQSLYAYDYASNEHMDVRYGEFGEKPRKSLILRKLEAPPALSSSSEGDEIVIKVEASTVSETDSIIRKGEWWGSEPAPLPNTPGVDVVGKIYHIKQKTSSKYGLTPSQTVVSLIRWGGNSRFLTVKPDQLVKVPEGLDPAQVACLPEVYLSAFQCLHFGQAKNTRYRPNALKGKSVLIIGFMANNMGDAMIQLALKAGAANIYATAKNKHWKALISYGVMPLSQDPMDWILRIEGTIDLVLATNGGLREDVSRIHYRALSPTGHLILCGRRIVGNDIAVGEWENQNGLMCSKNKALAKLMNKSHAYDVYEQWNNDLLQCKADLEHLLTLLSNGDISPNVLDRIALSKVPRAHELIESKRLSGFLVCEPWMKAKQRAVYM